MRESIGAGYIFTICIVFIMLFTAYLAFSVNYSKAFKIKSHIISEIEEAKGINEISDDIEKYLVAQGYAASGECAKGEDEMGKWTLLDDSPHYSVKSDAERNVCIYKLEVNSDSDDISQKRTYYRVTTFFKFDIPVFNMLLTFPVSGDSKYILEES